MENILICLERLDIGGVETAVVNQASYFLKMGYGVTILAKKGIYMQSLEDKGIRCIEFEFPLENEFDLEKANKIAQIIKEYQISQVHIHQFPCILSVLPACLMTGIPYVAYLHMSIDGVFQWYMNTYPIYQKAFHIYFICAEKIIAITEKTKQEMLKLFLVDQSKCLVLHNAICFEEQQIKDLVLPEQIKKMMLVTRFSKEKGKSIQQAITFFSKLYDQDPEVCLTIVGDGELKEEIEQLVQEKQIKNVVFLGSRNDVIELMKKADLVMRSR